MEINKPISIAVALAVALTIFFLFTLPKYQESVELELDLAKKRYQYEKRVEYYLKVADVIEEIEKNQDALGKVEDALPNSFDFAEIIFFLQEKTQEAKINFKSISFSKPRANKEFLSEDSDRGIKSVDFKIELSGSYQNLKQLLYSLEKSARLFEVSSIAFTSQPVFSRLRSLSQSYEFSLEMQTNTY